MLLPRTMFVAPTTRLRLVLLSLVVLLAALMVQAASAPSARAAQLDTTPIAGTTFEGGDGNVTRNEIGQIDWENLVPFTVTQDAASTSNSAVWGGGVKQEEPQTWFWQTGEVNDKTNILSAASVAKNLGDVFLYFGFQTEAASGNANFAIELNQLQPTYTSTEANTTPTTKRTTDLPRRKAGDLLISYDVTNSDVKIGACKWKGTAAIGEWVHADDATSIDSNEKTCHPLDSTKAEGAVNDTALAMPTGMGGTFAFPIPKDGFGEASINISKALGLGGTSTCFSFGSIWMHSRTSLELSSQPKDLMAPMELSLGSCSIDILKKQQVNTTAVDGYTTGSVDAYIGDTINYRLEVRNAGTQPITSVVPTDNDCGSISAPTKTGGNTDSILEVGELWVYTCSHPVAAGDVTAGTYRNTASVKGVVNSLELNDSSFVTAAVKSAGLTITKLQTTTPADATTYAPGPVTLYAGGTISYRLVITNTGTTTLSNIDVTDAGCTGLVDPAGTLAPGASVTVTCSKATANALTPTSYVNVASVTATDGTKSPTATSNSVTATTIKNGLVLDKKQATAANTAFIDATNAELTVRAGSTLHYLIEVTNTGNATVSNVTLADANCTATTPVASLAPNATTTFRCTQATTGSATRTNSAQATATDALGGTVTSNTDLVTARTVTTGLELEKVQSTTAPTTFADGTDQQVTVYAGATLYYVVRVKNTGNYPLTNVTLSDPGCSATTPLGSLDPGAYGSFLCSKVTDASAATYTNTATATGTDVLNAPVNSNGDFVVARTVTTGLVLDKKQATAANTAFADATNLQLTVPSGTTLHYVIEVHNTGNHALTNVTLTDANCTATTAIAQLDAGAYAYFRCTQSTNDTLATHDNSARATGTDVLSGPVVSNLDTVSARTLTSGLLLEKRQAKTAGAFASATHAEITVRSGDTIHYVIRVKNTGNYALTDVTLTDPNCSTTTPLASLAAGAEYDFTCSKTTSGAGTTWDNDAQATGTSLLGLPVTSLKDSVSARVVTTGLTLTKRQATTAGAFADATHGEITVRSGDTIHYVIRVKNIGNYALTNVTLTDPNCTTTTALASLATGAEFDFTCSKTTSGAGTTWKNEAQATGTDVLSQPVTSPKDDVTARVVTTGLTLEKRQSATAGTFEQASDAPLTVRSGDTIHYMIRVKNTGNYPLTNVTLDDLNCSATTPLLTLAPGAEYDFTCSKTTSGAGTTWNNEAQATGTSVFNLPVTSAKDDVTARVVTTGLTLTKRQATTGGAFADATHGEITVRSGDTIHYVIRVKNTGNYPLTNVTLDDPNCTTTTPIATLGAGAEFDFTCSKSTSGTGTTQDNDAQATGTDVLDKPVTSPKDVVTARVVTTGLTLDKRQALVAGTFAAATNAELTVRSGDTVHYVIRVTNTGNYALTNVTLTDPNCTTTTPLASLAAGAQFDFTCSKTTSGAGTTWRNEAQATGTDVLDKPVASLKDDVTARVVTTGLTLEKRQSATAGTFEQASDALLTVRSGDTIHYVIRVKNTGNYALTNVTLTDPNCSTTTPLTTLAAGAEHDFTCSKTTSGAGTTWNNEAQATGTDVLDKPVTSPKDDVTARVVTTGLTLAKRQATSAGSFADATHGQITVRSGDTIHYVIRVKNTGNYAVTHVTLTDPNCSTTTPLASLDAGAEYDFTCSKTTSGTGTTQKNEAQATGTDVLDKPVTSPKDDVTARVVTTGLTLDKRQSTNAAATFATSTDDELTVRTGTKLWYVIRVTNTGNHELTNVTLDDANCSTTTPLATLAAGAAHDFTCSKTTSGTDTAWTNEAQATGTDVLDKPVTSPKDHVSARTLTTGLTLDKRQSTNAAATYATASDADLTVRTNTTIYYVIRVKNTGNYELSNVTLTDANCTSTAVLATLAPNAEHDFTCSQATTGTATSHDNTAQATGTDLLGAPVTSLPDTVYAKTLTTGLALDKRQSTDAAATFDDSTDAQLTVPMGTTLYYVIRVKNKGNYALTNVTLTDANCTTTTAVPTLAPNDTFDFRCSQATTGTALTHDNFAVASGTDLLGGTVTSPQDSVSARTLTTGLELDKRQAKVAGAFADATDAEITVRSGDTIHYVIRVTNSGNYALTNVTLTDPNCSATTPIPTLGAGLSADFTCSRATSGAGTTQKNEAQATGTDLLDKPVTSPKDDVTARVVTTGLTLDKRQATSAGTFAAATDAQITVRSGDTIHYVIRAKNTGNYELTNVTLTDPNCSATTPLGTLAAGASYDFTCSKTTSGAGTTQKNEAQATGTDVLDAPVTSLKDDVTARVVTTGLELDKRQSITAPANFAAATHGEITVRSGDTIHYVIRVKNTGNYPLTDVTLDDPNCSATTPIGTLGAGAVAYFECASVTSGANATFTNTAQATGTDVLLKPVTSPEDAVTARVLTVGLELDKRQATSVPADFTAATDNDVTVRSGDSMYYVIQVKNTGNYALTNVTLDDPKCAGAAVIATLAAGATDYFTCSATTSGIDTTYVNTAKASGTDVLLGAVTSNTDKVTARVVTTGLTLDKRQAKSAGTFADATDAEITVRSGDTIHYVIRVKNTGNYPLTNVTLDDPNCTATTAVLTLAANAEHDYTCSKTTSGTDTTQKNEAQATGTDVLDKPVTSLKDDVTARVVTTGLTLDKRQAKSAGTFADATDAEITVRSGDTIHYVIRVKNTGNYALANVTLTDPNCTATTPVLTLATGAEHDFSCSKSTTGAAKTWNNEAQATGTDVLGQPVTSPKDDVTARVLTTGLTLDKRQAKIAGTFADATDAQITVRSGATLHYVIRVKNTGNYELTNVTLDDPACSATTAIATLAPDAEHDFTCSATTSGAATEYENVATASGTDVLTGTVTSNTDKVVARTLTTGLELDKRQDLAAATTWADATDANITAHAGDTIHYDIRVKNTGNYDVTNVTLDDTLCSNASPASVATLAPGATTLFTCDHTTDSTSNAATYTNTATAHAVDLLGAAVDSNPDSVVADLKRLELSLAKLQSTDAAGAFATTSLDVYAGATIHYQLVATNLGNVDTTVTPTDAGCTNLDATPVVIAPGKTATFTCRYATTDADAPLPSATTGMKSNQGSVSGTDAFRGSTGPVASNVVTANVHRLKLTTLKEQSKTAVGGFTTGSITVYAGETIYYRVTVTNDGNTPTTVTPHDAGCDKLAPTATLLAPGASTNYTCEHAATVADARSATGTYTNTANATGAHVNGGTTTSNDSAVTARVLVTVISMSKTVFDVETGTWTSSNRAHVGDTIRYTITVANTGNNTLAFELVDAKCTLGPKPTESIKAAATASYTCEHMVLATDGDTYVNTATIDGTDEGGRRVTDQASATTTILKPDFTLTKQVRVAGSGAAFAWTTSAHVGATLEYEIVVTNVGNTPLTFDLTDPACGALASTAPAGHDGVDDVIAPAASVRYSCTHVIGPLDPNPYVNVVRAVGTDGLGLGQAKDAHADATIVVPGLTVDKQVRNATANRPFTDSDRAVVGNRLEFRHTVSSTGNTPLTVNVKDDRCEGLAGPAGFDGVNDVLAPGQTVEYTCFHVLTATDPNPFVNVVTVTGTDPLGGPVTATDRASVTVDAVPVAAGGPAPVVGSSRLTPPSGCQRGAFRVLVTGSNIRLVQFLVDGRVRATVRRATSGNRWIGRLTTSGLRGGTTHRLAVRVTYTSATGQRAVVRSARFGVCRPVAVMPAFTG